MKESVTIFPDDPIETDNTDETYLGVSNDDFLETVFGVLAGEQRPVVCGFPGNPHEVAKARWFGRPWVGGKTPWQAANNNYFTLACFSPDEKGQYRRMKKNFVALHAIMLDDIGTKAANRERLTIPPSWLLETSEGNFQAGYVFNEPLTDGTLAERLMKSLIAANLCDPGADGPLARYARLPAGGNGKYDPPFICRLREYSPEARYSVEQIVDGLALDFDPMAAPQRNRRKGSSAGQSSGSEEIYVPRAGENPVVTKLKEAGLYIKPLGAGKHEINCPWMDEHTDGHGGGTAYFEPSESFSCGGFKCLHGHCADRHLRHLLDYLGISRIEAKHRPIIRVAAGELAAVVNHCEEELAATDRFYQRGGLLVHVVTDPGTRETVISPLSAPSVVRALSSLACFERFDKRSNEWVACDPPDRHCRVLYDSPSYPHLPVLQGLARQPFLRPDGSLVTAAGYDPATQMFGLFNPKEFNIPTAPTKEQADQAFAAIDKLLDEFSFKTWNDRAAAMAAILTAAIRPSLPLAPMFHCCAPQIASGKSYLTSLITAFATRQAASGIAFPQDDEECRKLLLATLMTSPSVVCFDNLTSDLLPHKSLCSTLTEEYITGRILGISKTATVGTRTLFLSSGNNVLPVRDMTRRALTIHLDPACETPATRTFKKQPLEEVLRNRGYYVGLALTIISGWIVAGRPMAEVKPLATYTDWSLLCRQPLLWLGCPDPATNLFAAMNTDPDREMLGVLLRAWFDCYGNQPVMIRQAVDSGSSELMQAFEEIALERGNINRKRLGRWIARHAGRIVDGLRFEKDSGVRSAEAWTVKSVTSVT